MAATMPGPSDQRLGGCRTPGGEYCRPVWEEMWSPSPVSSLEGVRKGRGGVALLFLGVREALEAGVFLTGRGSWEARPPGVNPHWGGSNIREATVSQLELWPLSNTLGHKH